MEASVAEQCSIRNLSIMPFTSPSYIAAAQCSSNTERSAVALLVWILAIGILFFFASWDALMTILWDTVLVKSTIRSGLPICLLHQIRIPNFFLNGAMLFREHLCFTSIVFTDICILTHHSFISTDNYDTHLLYLPFCCYLMLLEISLF